MTSKTLVIAGFATGRIRRLTEELAQTGCQVVLIDDADDVMRRASCGDFTVAIVHIPSNRTYLQELVPQLTQLCGVLVVVGAPGNDGETSRIRALMLGADDVVADDIGRAELAWRVQKVARISGRRGFPRSIGPLSIDVGEARLRGDRVPLSRTELRLLKALARNPDATQLREELHATVWGWPDADDAGSRTLDVYASRLRRKLARDGDRFVIAARGLGYRLR